MIDAKELRIGNWVVFHNLLEQPRNIMVTPRFFSSLAGGRSFEEQAKETQLNEYWHPIPLTTEILEKCGFEKCLRDGLGDYQILCGKGTNADGLFLIIDIEYFSFVIGQLKHFSHAFGEYKYLHQLQNLYYALTQKELEIKL